MELMGGTKFRGNIIENSPSRGSFCPKDSKLTSLSHLSLVKGTDRIFIYTKPHRTGIIQSMLEFLDEKSKDVILSCDGKLIRRALTEIVAM